MIVQETLKRSEKVQEVEPHFTYIDFIIQGLVILSIIGFVFVSFFVIRYFYRKWKN